jgi:AraC-like DNA-binding protein
MRRLATEPHLPLGRIIPPYREVEPVRNLSALAARRTTPGTLLVLDVTCLDEDWLILLDAVSLLRERFPAAPVILRVSEVTTDAVRLAQRASRLRVRALIGGGEQLYETLRPILTRPDDLGDDVVEWLSASGFTPSPAVSSLVRHILGRSPGFPQLGDLLDTIPESERTARHRFQRERLAPPSAWHQAARALHTALKIQADPDTPLLQMALDLGYSDHSGFSRQLSRTFGFTPGAIRGTLGWEWLLHRWLLRTNPAMAIRRDSSGNNQSLSPLARV